MTKSDNMLQSVQVYVSDDYTASIHYISLYIFVHL